MKHLNTSDIRRLDLIAQNVFSIPGLILMEHASLGLAKHLLSRLKKPAQRVMFLCGKGNNGGDGFAAARHLHNHGHKPEILLIGNGISIKAESEAATNFKIAHDIGIPIHECTETDRIITILRNSSCSVYLDAVFGTGLTTELRGIYPELFEQVNDLNLPFIAVDVPSGLNSDTGIPMGAAIRAVETVTFAFAKKGFLVGEGPAYCGDVFVCGIGLPKAVMDAPEKYL